MSTDLSPIYSAFAGDPDYQELVDQFVRDVPERILTLQTLASLPARDRLQSFAHQLKGAAGGYGFPGLTEAARRLELACQSDPERVPLEVAAVVHYLERLRT